MKKFIIPEISSVELSMTDVIMDSNLAQANNVDYSSALKITTDTDAYDIWKGKQK